MVASYQIDDECTSAPIASEGRPFHNGNVCKFPLIIIIVMHFKCWREGSSSSTAWPDKVRKSIRFIFSNECNAQRVINSLWIIMPVTYGSINAPSRRGRSTFALFNLFSLSLCRRRIWPILLDFALMTDAGHSHCLPFDDKLSLHTCETCSTCSPNQVPLIINSEVLWTHSLTAHSVECVERMQKTKNTMFTNAII